MSILMMTARDIEAQGKIIDPICSDEQSLQYLLLPFAVQIQCRDITGLFDDPETEMGTAEVLYEILHKAAPYSADLVVDFVCGEKILLIDFITDIWAATCCRLDNRDSNTGIPPCFTPRTRGPGPLKLMTSMAFLRFSGALPGTCSRSERSIEAPDAFNLRRILFHGLF